MRRGIRFELLAVGAVVTLALALSACAAGPRAVHPGGPTRLTPSARASVDPVPSLSNAGAPTPAAATDAASNAAATQLLAEAVLPPGATSLGARPAGAPSAPATLSACSPMADRVEYWTTGDDLATVQAWLTSHLGAGLRVSMTMSGPGEAAALSEVPVIAQSGAQSSELEYTLVRLANTTVARVDALAVPLDAACSSSGGAAGAVSGPAG